MLRATEARSAPVLAHKGERAVMLYREGDEVTDASVRASLGSSVV